ncbi:HemK family protein methyltransferase [Candidatus Gracilibacteria bacterium]|nr:HemK family protein methyltransferase [Candidatus Gracilibacteria bacterium]
MKKIEIVTLGKEKYNLNSKTINMVLEFVFGLSKEKVFLLDELDEIYLGQIIFIFEKLNLGYPLAYIIKKANFMGEDFYVDENVLIPRDDTEVLVKAVIREEELTQYTLIDIGTGSGIIPISLVKKMDFEGVYAIDVSDKAVEVAKENVFRHSLEDKVVILKNDFKKFEFELFRGKDLIVTANLPYIKEGDFKNMDFSVYKFEPKTALYGGINTGFELYEELIKILMERRNLFNTLDLFIEIGFDQYEISKKFLEEKGLKFEFFKDTNKIYRVIKIVI